MPLLIHQTSMKKLILISSFILFCSASLVHSVMEKGHIVSDKYGYWQNSQYGADASYIVCDGYIGSPSLKKNSPELMSYVNNCEITPPLNSVGIIDVAENHSDQYEGYPAYIVIKEDNTPLFVCNGFLSSTSWCSLEAERQASKLQRVQKTRQWEVKSPSIYHTAYNQHQQVTTLDVSLDYFIEDTINQAIEEVFQEYGL